MRKLTALVVLSLSLGCIAEAGVLTFGDADCLGQGCYGATDPTTGATLQGLATDLITLSSNSFGHGFPIAPDAGDYAGTDQIYVGSTQTGAHDGYSVFSGRINGPQIISLDYSSLIPAGESLTSLTLGIAADDFQFPSFGQPFTATVNGVVNTALGSQLNLFNESGPIVQFFTIGLSTSVDPGNHILTLAIDEGGDGWGVDFLTIGVTTQPSGVPEPSSFVLFAAAGFLTLTLAAVRRLSTRVR